VAPETAGATVTPAELTDDIAAPATCSAAMPV